MVSTTFQLSKLPWPPVWAQAPSHVYVTFYCSARIGWISEATTHQWHETIRHSVRGGNVSQPERHDRCRDGVILGEVEKDSRHQEVIAIMIVIVNSNGKKRKEKGGQKPMLKRYKARGCASLKTALLTIISTTSASSPSKILSAIIFSQATNSLYQNVSL